LHFKRSTLGCFFNNYTVPYIGIMHHITDKEMDIIPVCSQRDPCFFVKYDTLIKTLIDLNIPKPMVHGLYDDMIIDDHTYSFYRLNIANTDIALIVEDKKRLIIKSYIIWLPVLDCKALEECQFYSGFFKNIVYDEEQVIHDFEDIRIMYLLNIEIPYYIGLIIRDLSFYHFSMFALKNIVYEIEKSSTKLTQIMKVIKIKIQSIEEEFNDVVEEMNSYNEMSAEFRKTLDEVVKVYRTQNINWINYKSKLKFQVPTRSLRSFFSLFFFCTIGFRKKINAAQMLNTDIFLSLIHISEPTRQP
jgi:hypothetical protein